MAENSAAEVISIGTMLRGSYKTLKAIDRFIPIGIESVEIFFWESIDAEQNHSWMEKIVEKCNQTGLRISTLGLYANPLRNRECTEKASEDWNTIIDFAHGFQIPVVSGFTGRIPGKAAEESLLPVKDFFSPVINNCLAKGLKLGFENCPMDGDRSEGDWNIAFLPDVWDILLDGYFNNENVGLEFDPGHLVHLGYPVMELLEKWLPRIHHIHGKDAKNKGSEGFCFPGEGKTNWKKLLAKLQSAGYRGSVDLEGYHGEFISHEAELERQKKSLRYLNSCRP